MHLYANWHARAEDELEDLLFSGASTAVARERKVARGWRRALRKGLGGAQAAAPVPGTWATPRAKGGRPKVRIRPNSSEFPAPGGSWAVSPLPAVKFSPRPRANSQGGIPTTPSSRTHASAEQAPSAGTVAARATGWRNHASEKCVRVSDAREGPGPFPPSLL